MRLIDADELREKACWMEMLDNQGVNYDVHAVSVSSIDFAPTIEAEPVRHGRWVEGKSLEKCSICGKKGFPDWRYCPNCGAKMDLEE